MHHKVNNTPSDLNLPRVAQKRDQVVMVLVYADEFKAIEAACIKHNVSRSSLIHEILRIATGDFTNITIPVGAKLRRRQRTQPDGGASSNG